jgi:hypothetical protein
MAKEKPRFEHDCDCCKFLGTLTLPKDNETSKRYKTTVFDLYFCKQEIGDETVISRFGNKGYEYTSGLRLAVEGKYGHPNLLEAKRRAIKLGYLPQYEHDCDNCVFLGQFSFKDNNYDLYTCTDTDYDITTVIARFSDTPGDNLSGFLHPIGDCTGQSPALHEARKRASELEHLSK